jgi:hypothetical protein
VILSEDWKGEAYCVKCKEAVPTTGYVEEVNGRRFAKGFCPDCGGKVTRILGKKDEKKAVVPVLKSDSRPYSNWEGLPDGWTPQMGMDLIHELLEFGDDSTQKQIAEVGIALTALLIYKNQRYGNSALDPVEVFTKGLTKRQRMAVRMDDKVNRLKNGLGARTDDKEHAGIDLAGYILLDVIAEWEERQ